MARESTLDEFCRDDDAEPADGDRSAADDPTDPTGADASADVDPADGAPDRTGSTAPITCEWTPGGAACEACGATVERRWRDGAARVCADCKEW